MSTSFATESLFLLKYFAGDNVLNRFFVLITIFFTVLTSGCAIVTTYGKEPEKLENNTYKFKLYYNVASTDKDIDKKAQQIKNEIEVKNNHSDCKFIRQYTNPNSGSQSIVYTVKCT